MTNGPAAVTLSAPWALATTVTFTTPGTYTFRLTASNGTSTGTSSVTVTVNDASSQTAFYVDPTYTGSTQDGSASAPWKSLLDSDSNYSTKWTTIRNARASNPVIIYFSARQAGSGTAEQLIPSTGYGLFVNSGCRSGTARCSGPTYGGTNRLTLDGMSLYNANDATPNWVPNTGSNRFKVNCTSACGQSLGWNDGAPHDYVTMRGFEVTGNSARIRWGGSYSVIEYLNVHDITTLGATVQYNEFTNGGLCANWGADQDITVRRIAITNGIGEGLYIAGNYNYVPDGGCVTGPQSGDNHHDLLIESNIITNAGANGAEGDGIDIKSGIYDVTVRGNTIISPRNSGISLLGRMPNSTHESNYLIENNVISNSAGNAAIAFGAIWGGVARNNIIKDANYGIVAWTRQAPQTPNCLRIRIYGNTIYSANLGINLSNEISDTPIVRNNILLANTTALSGSSPGIDSDYNFFAPSGSSLSEGTHSITQASASGVVVNAAGGDFHLVSASPARNAGVSLTATFAADITGAPRPEGTAWDIGAYQYGAPGQAPPAAPTGLRIIP